MKVNRDGTFHVMHAWLPALRRSKGAIVNVASVARRIRAVNALTDDDACVAYQHVDGANASRDRFEVK
ncbi:hypothetical protein D8I24_2715 (plasmid) [Cupriavidus necator H850]|uniref:hypothetical protein n=1 Tax=Cupriavidus necator TaxID=106590 RepID=UPI001E650015|nr:hypothetical protein [Cupriavidus necator]KAI3604126.1 hypothetical protein D8I24_2715 [Cupriavidus necator H850]